jgi:hypothetical protein
MRIFFFCATAMVLSFTAQIALAQTWRLTGPGSNDWLCVASSANGQTVIAGRYPGFLYVSTNAGSTWTTNVTLNGYWASVASSADGTKLMAAAEYEGSPMFSGVFLSTNAGVNWTSNNLPALYWGSVAMSADGKILAAAQPYNSQLNIGGSIFCSTNSGITWTSNSLTFACGAAMSADGRKIFVTGPEQLCYSTNFGTSWTVMTTAPPSYSFASPSQYIASSADGNRLLMYAAQPGGNQGFIYSSTNSGATWTPTSLPESSWSFVASSGAGQTLMAAAGGFVSGPLFVSTNAGASWTTNSSENWAGVACSADGGTLFAVAMSDNNSDGDSGAIFKSQFIQPPSLNVTAAGPDLLLSWLIPSTNFAPEESGDLRTWTGMTNTPSLNFANLQNQIRVSPTNRARFYRLAH